MKFNAMNACWLSLVVITLAGCESAVSTSTVDNTTESEGSGATDTTEDSATIESGDVKVAYSKDALPEGFDVSLTDSDTNPNPVEESLRSFKIKMTDADGKEAEDGELDAEITLQITLDKSYATDTISILITNSASGDALAELKGDDLTFSTNSDGHTVVAFSTKFVNSWVSILSGSSSSSDDDDSDDDASTSVVGTVKINSDNAYTASTSVTLTLNSATAAQMYVTNTAGCASGGTWETFATSKSWTLGQTNAVAKVYVKFKNSGGTESACVNDSIVHDSTGPSAPGSVDDGTTHTSVATTPTFTWLAATDGAGIGSYQVAIGSSAGGTDVVDWTSAGTSLSFSLGSLSLTDGNTYYMSVRAIDSLGNVGAVGQGDGWTVAVPVSSVGAVSLSMSAHVCAILTDGSVKCWGKNTKGRLGYGDEVDRATPISATVDLGTGRTAISLSTSSDSTCAVLDNNTVKCWGKDNNGYLGYGDFVERHAPEATATVDFGGAVDALTSYDDPRCALLSDGSVKCWGSNWSGQLGYGDTTDRDAPDTGTALDLGASRTATQIASGEYHNCALLDDESIKCWGYNPFGGVGDGTTTDATSPTEALPSGSATAVAAGSYHSCAILKTTNTVKCWGYNNYGQLGYGDTTNRTSPAGTTIDLGAGRTAKKLHAGLGFTCAILDDDTLKCWGRNHIKQLGYGDTTDRTSPEATAVIDLGAGRTAVDVAGTGGSLCAVLDDASVKCWGYNFVSPLIWNGVSDIFTP